MYRVFRIQRLIFVFIPVKNQLWIGGHGAVWMNAASRRSNLVIGKIQYLCQCLALTSNCSNKSPRYEERRKKLDIAMPPRRGWPQVVMQDSSSIEFLVDLKKVFDSLGYFMGSQNGVNLFSNWDRSCMISGENFKLHKHWQTHLFEQVKEA